MIYLFSDQLLEGMVIELWDDCVKEGKFLANVKEHLQAVYLGLQKSVVSNHKISELSEPNPVRYCSFFVVSNV